MQLKNKAEREAFLRNYSLWNCEEYEFPRLGVPSNALFAIACFSHIFNNGATVIATKCHEDVRYNLIIPDGDDYNPWDTNSGHTPTELKSYNLTGQSISTIVQYMTARRGVISQSQ